MKKFTFALVTLAALAAAPTVAWAHGPYRWYGPPHHYYVARPFVSFSYGPYVPAPYPVYAAPGPYYPTYYPPYPGYYPGYSFSYASPGFGISIGGR